MAEETIVVEADAKNFEKILQEKENALRESEKRYLTRLTKEAREAGLDMKEDELLAIGEKGILALIEQAKKAKPAEKAAVASTERAQGKGIVTDQTAEMYEPDWAKGPIICNRNEMYREWNYDYFRGG